MIPAELRDLPQWLAWRVVERDSRRTKIPVSPHGGAGKSNDPATWGTYREALAVLTDGVGFVFADSDPYLGVDMDACVSAGGAIHPDAYAIVRQLNGYVEFSPSGYGLHVIVRARLERGRHTLKTPWGNELALYSAGRFFTMSGEGRGTIKEAQAEVNALIAYYFPEDEQGRVRAPVKPFCGPPSDTLDRMLADPRIAALHAGDLSAYNGDHSAADLAYCSHAAFWTNGDPARIDALMRSSGLYREKWEREDYREATIRKAIEGGR